MNIIIVSSGDLRNREKFLVEPLQKLHHRVITCKSTSELLRQICIERRKVDLIMCVGIGLSASIAYIASHIVKARFGVRTGGDVIGDIQSRIDFEASDFFKSKFHQIRHILARNLLQRVKYMVVVSPALVAKLEPYTAQDCIYTVIPQPVRGEYIPIQYKSQSSEVMTFLTATNLQYKEKAEGVVALINAFEKICKNDYDSKLPKIRLVVAGDGPARSIVDKRVAELDELDGFESSMLGYVSDMEALYKQHDVFIYCSSRDAVPNVLLEARRFSLICVVYESDLSPEVFSHGLDGYIANSEGDILDLLLNQLSSRNNRSNILKHSHKRLWDRHSSLAVETRVKGWIDSIGYSENSV